MLEFLECQAHSPNGLDAARASEETKAGKCECYFFFRDDGIGHDDSTLSPAFSCIYMYIDEYIYTYNTHTKYTSKELMIPDWVQEKIEKS